MDENIEAWLLHIRLNWRHLQTMVKEVRGVVRDRKGKHSWLSLYEYRGHFPLSLYAWPSWTFFDDLMVGWIAFGVTQNPTSWRIGDILVRHKRRGIGTVLVKESIALARRRGAQELRGVVTTGDAQSYPFLPAWYAQLGFTVKPAEGEWCATFSMDL